MRGRRWGWRCSPLWAAAALLLLMGGSSPALADDEDDLALEEDGPVDEEKAFLLAKKFLSHPKDMVVGRNATIKVEVFNAGTSAAYDVEVSDADWDTRFFAKVDGSLEASFERVSAGASASFEYVVRPLTSASGRAGAATLRYKPSADSDDVQVGFSTVMPVAVFSEAQMWLRWLLLVGSYATLGSVRTGAEWQRTGIVLGVVGLLSGGLLSYLKVTDAQQQRRRKQALSEVEKMK